MFKKSSCGISIPCVVLLAWNFQGLKGCLVFSGISKAKVTNLKIPGFFFRKVYPQPPV